MLRDVVRKSLRDQRRSLPAWMAGLVALVAMYAGMFPSVHSSSAYTDVVEQMPDSVRALFTAGASGDFSTGAGYVTVELLSFMAPMLVLLYAIGTGAAAIAGEEERHTLDLLLSAPVSRRRVVVEKFAAMATGVALLAVTMGVALVGLGAAAGMGLSAGNVAATVLHLALLGLVFGALALAVGAATGRLAPARAGTAGVAVLTYLVNGFAPTVGWLRPVQKLSPFYQYLGHAPIRHGLSIAAVGIAAGTVAVLVVLAVRAFHRRDVAA